MNPGNDDDRRNARNRGDHGSRGKGDPESREGSEERQGDEGQGDARGSHRGDRAEGNQRDEESGEQDFGQQRYGDDDGSESLPGNDGHGDNGDRKVEQGVRDYQWREAEQQRSKVARKARD